MGVLSKLISLFAGARSEPRISSPSSPVPSRIGESHSHRVNEWVESQKKAAPKKKRAKPAARQLIDSVAFSYEDRDGNHTDRTVDVFSSDDEYFEGFCHSRLGTRTFKISRVAGLVISVETGEAIKPQAWLRKIYSAHSNTHVISGNDRLREINPSFGTAIDSVDQFKNKPARAQILFTGFDRERRADLEEMADLFDMKVVKTVTKNLSYLCTGKNPAPSKEGSALEVDAEIIDEEEFLSIIRVKS